MPTVLVDRIERHAPVTKELPLFTGYIFVQYARGDDRWKRVASTRGVKSLMLDGDGDPVPLRRGEAELLAERCAAGPFRSAADVAGFFAKVGDRVVVSAGAFAGQEGVCVASLARRELARISLDMFMRRTVVEVPCSWIRAAA